MYFFVSLVHSVCCSGHLCDSFKIKFVENKSIAMISENKQTLNILVCALKMYAWKGYKGFNC